jgi:hypothetical protein
MFPDWLTSLSWNVMLWDFANGNARCATICVILGIFSSIANAYDISYSQLVSCLSGIPVDSPSDTAAALFRPPFRIRLANIPLSRWSHWHLSSMTCVALEFASVPPTSAPCGQRFDIGRVRSFHHP